MDAQSLASVQRTKSLQTLPNAKTKTKSTKSVPQRSKSTNQIPKEEPKKIQKEEPKNVQKEEPKKIQKEEPKKIQKASNGRYSCFCLDIGIKSYDPPASITTEDTETQRDYVNEIKQNENKVMNEFHLENYYQIFKQETNLTLPVFKIIASYFFFMDKKWLVGLEKKGHLINKFTWVRGTKHVRQVYICLGFENKEGLSLSEWELYWIVPGKNKKIRRRTIPLHSIEKISPGKNTVTFERKAGTTAVANRCLSISFLHSQFLPQTKSQRTFLRTLDLEFEDDKIRNQFVIFLSSFLWIYKSK